MDRDPNTAPAPNQLGKQASVRGNSPLWNRALEKYAEELDGDADEEVLAGAGSLEDLVAYAKTIEPLGSHSNTTLDRLGPTLKFVDDFSAIVAICLGANARVIAFVWGSLRMIITLASSTDDTLQQAVDMLEELSLSLPRLRYYEKNLPLDRSLESAMIDLYSEIICFYARLIRHYRAHPHLPMQQTGWSSFQKDFVSTIRRVKYLSSVVEKEADIVKMKVEAGKYAEVLEALKTLGDRKAKESDVKQYYHIPALMNPRFVGREPDLVRIKNTLAPDDQPAQLKSLALYGMGGVGKTQLALRYALGSKTIFDTILWIAADTSMSLEQGFRDVAAKLGLSRTSDDGTNELSATARVKDWLCDTNNNRKWLVVFDNADDITLLHHVWPSNGTGSVLITSRDFSTASLVAQSGLHLQPFNVDEGSAILLQLLNVVNPDETQILEARNIAQELGGLPLALDQITSFIIQRKLRIQDFLPLYLRNSAKIDARLQGFAYPHSLATVFEMTLNSLSGFSLHLQNLLALLEPDSIPESIFEDGYASVTDPDLAPLGDEIDLGDAEESLLQAALIGKNSEERSLSVHRLIQTAVLRRMSLAKQRKYFKVATELLSLGFPETWSKDIGHQKRQWEKCERYLPHINALVKVASSNDTIAQDPDSWAELLLRCSWYLYEKEQYTYVRAFTEMALRNFTNKDTLAYASAVDLLGLVSLDMALPHEALKSFEAGLSIRQELLGPTDPFIAFALNNLALAYTEVPDLSKAIALHQQAIDIRLQNNSERIGNSYSNYAVTLLRKGQPDSAEEILMKCPSLQGCTDETFLAADNPRFVGDMVLLSRIRRAQKRSEEALRLASKAFAWRQKVHGDRFKTCDSMYDVACLLHEEEQTATALDLLANIVRVAETLDMGQGQAARAEWKASLLLGETGRADEGQQRLQNALRLRREVRTDETDVTDPDTWESLVPYMLW